MKHIMLITERDLGDNLSELLSLLGFRPSLLSELDKRSLQEAQSTPDLLICEEDFLQQIPPSQVQATSPIIILTDNSSPDQESSRNQHLLMPFSDEELFQAVTRSLQLGTCRAVM